MDAVTHLRSCSCKQFGALRLLVGRQKSRPTCSIPAPIFPPVLYFEKLDSTEAE